MDETQFLFNSWKTCLELANDRGFKVDTNYNKVSMKEFKFMINDKDSNKKAYLKSTIISDSATANNVIGTTDISDDNWHMASTVYHSSNSTIQIYLDGALQNSFKIWNAKLAYRKGKDAKWEYEIEGSNLLATGSRTTVSQNNISFNINETFILPRFISFRVRYQL